MVGLNPKLLALAAELRDDPEGRGYTGMTPDQVAADLSAARYTRTHAVDVATVQREASNAGILPRILAAQAAGNLHAGEAAAFLGGQSDTMDFASDGAQRVLAGLVTDGVLNAAERQALEALGTQTESRAQQLGYTRAIPSGWIATIRALEG